MSSRKRTKSAAESADQLLAHSFTSMASATGGYQSNETTTFTAKQQSGLNEQYERHHSTVGMSSERTHRKSMVLSAHGDQTMVLVQNSESAYGRCFDISRIIFSCL